MVSGKVTIGDTTRRQPGSRYSLAIWGTQITNAIRLGQLTKGWSLNNLTKCSA